MGTTDMTRENPVKLAAASAAKTLAAIIQRAVKGFFLTSSGRDRRPWAYNVARALGKVRNPPSPKRCRFDKSALCDPVFKRKFVRFSGANKRAHPGFKYTKSDTNCSCPAFKRSSTPG